MGPSSKPTSTARGSPNPEPSTMDAFPKSSSSTTVTPRTSRSPTKEPPSYADVVRLSRRALTSFNREKTYFESPPKQPLYLHMRRLDQLHTEAEHSIIKYGKASCLQLCNMLQEKLPAELRDMVYDYITGPQPILAVNQRVEGTVDGEANSVGERKIIFSTTDQQKRTDCVSHPHCWNPNYMGMKTVVEYGKHYFGTTWACLLLGASSLRFPWYRSESEDLGKFLDNVGRREFNPRDLLEREVYPLGYTLGSLLSEVEVRMQTNDGCIDCFPEHFVPVVSGRMHDLSLLKERAIIRFVLEDHRPQRYLPINFFERIFRPGCTVYRLKEAGYRVLLLVESDVYCRGPCVVHGTPQFSRGKVSLKFVLNVNEIDFSAWGNIEEWKEHWETHFKPKWEEHWKTHIEHSYWLPKHSYYSLN